jgi:hypothetical protein
MPLWNEFKGNDATPHDRRLLLIASASAVRCHGRTRLRRPGGIPECEIKSVRSSRLPGHARKWPNTAGVTNGQSYQIIRM